MDKEAQRNEELIHNLENVDQRQLAKENAFLRWLVVVFVVALVVTALALPHVGQKPLKQEAQGPQDYSNRDSEVVQIQYQRTTSLVTGEPITYVF